MFKINKELIRFIRAFLVLAGFILLINIIFPLPSDKLEKDYSTVIRARDSTILYVTLSPHQTYRFHTPLADISPYVVRGFVRYEDKYFFWHPGVNPAAVLRAFLLNWKEKRVVSGASTITMQIARMLEPKSRTFFNKALEMLRAWQLEICYSKKELLEIYLNTVPMGGNIQGVAAASWIYFGKEVGRLSPSEAAILVSIPRAPDLNRPDRGMERTARLRNMILENFYRNRSITRELLKESLSSPVVVRKKSFPFLAPHLVMRVLGKKNIKTDIRLTVDPETQSLCERIVRYYLHHIQKYRINNLSVLVVDNRTMKVKAYIGSPDFFDREHNGQNDGIISRRSPGSTLKPFIYARAFDKGLVTPASLVYDVPRVFRDYQPRNFSQEYLGLVDVRQALVNSLNVPAVEMLYRLAPSSMKAFLEEIGVSTACPFQKELGLPVALGSFPMTLENLAGMYASLAGGGVLRKIIYEEDKETFPLKRIMSAESAYLVTDILSGLVRPDLPASWEFTRTLPRIAWKTGTSFGMSDAWSIGYNPDYTIGVWVGNFSGAGSPALVGMETATPLLFSLFNEVARGSDAWFTRPDGLGTRKVCSLSGAPANPSCTDLEEDYYIPGVSPEGTCELHKIVKTDKATGYIVCDHCKKDKELLEKVMIDFCPEYLAWVSRKKNLRTDIMEHDPSCPQFASGNGPKIRFPVQDGVYYFRENKDPQEQALTLEAETGSDASRLFWFVNRRFLAESGRDSRTVLPMKPGKYKLTCLDNRGRSDEVEFTVCYR
ncbi:MAG: penicillin-binding protein 1C [bacterium]|nr:penicillin-binding protein 1C [bacterium]